ncbi:MAG TPA: alkaline phosphatase family protein [Anaerolineales bacterium]|nr:alkaline phosphatase family protein [Anaerolineales bacterium]
MKQERWLSLGILGCLLIAAGAYFWANSLMNSLYAFRSPLRDHPPAPGPALGQGLTGRVVFVLIDALRDDTSHKADVMPFLNQLRSEGAWATVHSRTPSYSEPGWSVLMIGAWPDLSDAPAMNLDYADIPSWTQDNLFRAAQRQGLRTAVSGFNWWQRLVPETAVNDSFYTAGEDRAADVDVVGAALPWLQADRDQFVLIHIDQVDYAGHHEGGPQSPNWDAAAERADGLLQQIVSTLNLSKDTVIVTSDHGQIDRGGHGGQDPIVLVEPLVIAGRGIKPGQYPDGNMVDTAPTTAALLGLNIPADSEGVVRTDMLSISADQQLRIDQAMAAQKSQLLTDYEQAIGYSASFPVDPNSVPDLMRAMDSAKSNRLRAERGPRLVWALILALIPAGIGVWRRSRKLAWLLGGAILYIVLFNFGYAVLAGRTYSLSSVASSSDIISFTAETAAVSLIIAWLVLAIRLDWFKTSPGAGALNTLVLVLTTLYLLWLPVVWSYAVNGALVSWTTPDMASMFMGFLSILQGLIVAGVGVLLTGATAAIALATRPRK